MKVKLGDIVQIVNGSTPSTEIENFWDGDIVWFTPKDLSDQQSKYVYRGARNISEIGFKKNGLTMLPVDSVLLTSRAPIGLLAINKVECCTNQGFKSLIPNKEKVDFEYLYYFLVLHKKDIERIGSGTTFKEVSKTYLSQFELSLPILPEQREISRCLSTIDKKIDINTQINTELESLAKTIYDYWFLQFDFPNEEGKPYKSSGGAMIWNEDLKMEIPEGWKSTKIKEIVGMISGYPFSTENYTDSGQYKLYTIKNIQDGFIESKVDNKLGVIPLNMPPECLLHKGDILMSLTGNVGRVGLVYEDNVLLNQRILKLVPKYNDLSYVYMLLRSDMIRKKAENISTGTSQKNLSPIDLGKIIIPYPPTFIISEYSKQCNLIFEKIVEGYAENQELTNLRDFLLPLLMNGQVGFKDT